MLEFCLINRLLFRKSLWILIGCLTLLLGCSSQTKEHHYFATFNETAPGVRVPTQFFRVNVEGGSEFANARYLTGYFDERAISLFFNEMKSPANGKIFYDDQKNPGTDVKLTPLNAPNGEGTFVLIMSTNADSIASTIGSFAESQVVADSMTRVLNRDRYKAKVHSDAMVSIHKAEAGAIFSRVDAQTKMAKGAASGDAAASNYKRALTALAQGLGYTGLEFTSVEEAQTWFSIENRDERATQ